MTQTALAFDVSLLRHGVTRNIYVVDTYAIGERPPQRGIREYEIQVAPRPDATAPRFSFRTPDARLYRHAYTAEDTRRCFDAAWEFDGTRYVLVALDERK